MGKSFRSIHPQWLLLILFFIQGKWCWTEVEKTVVHQKYPKGMPLLQTALMPSVVCYDSTYTLGASLSVLTLTETDQRLEVNI